MGLEAATFIQSLDVSNPVATDPRRQGDDHLRLIKNVLKANFPNATKAFYLPVVQVKAADFAVLTSDMNCTFAVDTTGAARTATLPILAAGDAGWRCSFFKATGDVNPIFIAPPSGTILSGGLTVTKTRRAIPGVMFDVVWGGTGFVVERILRQPVGSVIDFPGAALPVGFEWANGQTLAAGNYPDLNAALATTTLPDLRSKAAVGRSDMGGANNGLLTGGTVLNATLGTETVTLTIAQLPASPGGLTMTISALDVYNQLGLFVLALASGAAGVANTLLRANTDVGGTPLPISQSLGGTVNGTIGGTLGSGQSHSNVQPSLIMNKVVVVE